MRSPDGYETAALMLGSDKSRGYCMEMICADFLAGANLDDQNPETLLCSMTRFFQSLPGEQQQAFLENLREITAMKSFRRSARERTARHPAPSTR
jgi:hypothetical protein